MSPATAEPKSKSTGPRTEEGKKRSAMNATRHGLTGRTIVMPYEDMEAYHAFCNEFFESLAPETPVERQYAQTFCDTQWRLNRALSIEDAMLSLGHAEAAGNIETEHPQVYAALTAARVFRDDSKSFVNLSLYEQRLQRTLDKTLKQLQALQAERREQSRARQQAAPRTVRFFDRRNQAAGTRTGKPATRSRYHRNVGRTGRNRSRSRNFRPGIRFYEPIERRIVSKILASPGIAQSSRTAAAGSGTCGVVIRNGGPSRS